MEFGRRIGKGAVLPNGKLPERAKMGKKWLERVLREAVHKLLVTLLTELLAWLSTGETGDKGKGEK